MPRRTDSQALGDIGLMRVMSLCTDAGWICDRIVSDFGEDMIVQFSCRGNLDPFRMYIQVKSTKRDPFAKSDKLSLTFPKALVRKWLLSPDLVVIVVWDAVHSKPYWTAPSSQHNHKTLSRINANKVRIEISCEDELTSAALVRVEWMARIRNYNNKISEIRSYEYNIDSEWREDEIADLRRSANEECVLIAQHFLNDLEIFALCPNCFNSVTLASKYYTTTLILFAELHNLEEKIESGEDIKMLGLGVNQVALLIILRRVAELGKGLGVPGLLLNAASHLLACALRAHLDEGGTASLDVIM